MSKLDQALKDSHSSTEFHLDLLVHAVTSRLGNLESKTTEVSCQMSDHNNRVHQKMKSVNQSDVSAPLDPEYPPSGQSEPGLLNGAVQRPRRPR